MSINLTQYTFDAWLDFIFKHPVTALPFSWSFEEAWQYECESDMLVIFMTRLFSEPDILVTRYSYPEIDQGFWFIPGPNGFMWTLLDEHIEWFKRKACIDSIQSLFSRLFSKHNIGTSGYMWWDSFISYCAYHDKNIETEHDVLEAVLEVLKALSQQDSQVSVDSAKHGIEHLVELAKKTHNTSVKQLVAQYF